jgi:hypothetical protein
MALANGKSSIRCGPVTLHTDTAIHVAKQLTNVSNLMFSLNIPCRETPYADLVVAERWCFTYGLI